MVGAVLATAALPVQAADPVPGTRFQVRLEALPAPGAEPGVANPPRRVARGHRKPKAPPGFTVRLFAEGLRHARLLTVAPNGDVFIAESRADRITALRDTNGDGRADRRSTFAEGLSSPSGLAFHGDNLYVADVNAVWRYRYRSGDMKARTGRERVTRRGALGRGSGHWTRTLAVAPDGQHLFVGIGSRGNIQVEPSPRATIQRFTRDGRQQQTWASGLRNPVGLAFRPGTNALYTVVNERDGEGDQQVPDYLTQVRWGQFFGWPYAWIGPHPQAGFADTAPEKVKATATPDLLFKAHSAPLGLAFLPEQGWPAGYGGNAVVALHGSWNAGDPRGYMVVRVPFGPQGPRGHYEALLTGFRTGDHSPARVWGRPVGVGVGPNGTLYVSDDVGQTIWSVRPPRS